MANILLRALDAIEGHRTWIAGTLISVAFTVRLVMLPNTLFVATTATLADILYALAVLIGASKVAEGMRDRLRNGQPLDVLGRLRSVTSEEKRDARSANDIMDTL